jgi:hypothetical protein
MFAPNTSGDMAGPTALGVTVTDVAADGAVTVEGDVGCGVVPPPHPAPTTTSNIGPVVHSRYEL